MLSYRPEIDGLRTLAVMSVLFYHAEFFWGRNQFFSGGYLGVDIFFVISGFLITSILLRELQETGRISIFNFYERRARRLLPALLAVIFVSIPLAWHYLLPSELINYSWSVLSSLLFGSNIFWHFSLQEYGAQSSLLKPFLHTWSLAVEEQFYIVFPLLLTILFSRFRRHLLSVVMICFVLSLEFSVWMTARDSSFSFYMLSSRFWELLAGAGLAISMSQQPALFYSTNKAKRLAPGLGLIMILSAVVYFDLESQHPGYITLIPVLGTVMIIAFANEKDMVTRLLSSKVFVGVGLISYSLYLWHYPIFAFGRIADATPTWHDKLQWFFFTFLLSVATYFFLEKPFRNRKKIALRTFVVVIVSATILVVFLMSFWITKDGLSERLPPIIQKALKADRTDRFATGFGSYLKQNQIENVFLLGDSHAGSLEPEIFKVLPRGTIIHDLTKGGCPFFPGFDRFDHGNKLAKKCTSDYQNSRKEKLQNSLPSLVIVASRLPMYLSGELFVNPEGGVNQAKQNKSSKYEFRIAGHASLDDDENTDKMIESFQHGVEELQDYGHTVVLIYPVPEVGKNVPAQLNKRLQGIDASDVVSTLSAEALTSKYADYKNRARDSFRVLDQLEADNIYRVYPDKWLCDSAENKCLTHNENEVFYKDDNHLSAYQLSILLDEVAKVLTKDKASEAVP